MTTDEHFNRIESLLERILRELKELVKPPIPEYRRHGYGDG